MPRVPEEIFMEGMRQLIELDKNWIPHKEDHSLYIRPFMFSSDEMIGVRPSETYKFMIILSPTGPYYSCPDADLCGRKICKGSTGWSWFCKSCRQLWSGHVCHCRGKEKGYDQVLWTDAFEHKYVQECGTMNVFFIIGNIAITPDLKQGTILEGVTTE